MTDSSESNVTKIKARAPLRVVADDEAHPMGAPDPEVIHMLEDMLVLAREGRLRALGIAAVTEGYSLEPDEDTEQLTLTRFTSVRSAYNYGLCVATRRLANRVDDKYV